MADQGHHRTGNRVARGTHCHRITTRPVWIVQAGLFRGGHHYPRTSPACAMHTAVHTFQPGAYWRAYQTPEKYAFWPIFWVILDLETIRKWLKMNVLQRFAKRRFVIMSPLL